MVTNHAGWSDSVRVRHDEDPGTATAMQLRALAGVFAVIGATDVLLAFFAMELWPVATAVAAGLFAGLL